MGKNTNKRYDLLVIGAGASGMMAAIIAARENKKVSIIEKLDKVGKKLLATGNGKCNFTNELMDAQCFHGDKAFVEHVLQCFTVEDCLQFFHSIGIYPKQKNGYYYPNSEQASSVVLALSEELRRLSVEIKLQTKVDTIQRLKDGFCLISGNEKFYGNKVIVATGLIASPKLGSDGSLCGFSF